MVYDVLVALHVVAAVIGFGAVALSGVYGAIAARPERPEVTEETTRYFRSPGRAEWLLLAVPVLGGVALGVRPEGSDFGAFWVVAAAVVWLGAASLLIWVIRPSERRIRHGEPGAGRQLTWAAAASDVLFVVALVLMVGQPA